MERPVGTTEGGLFAMDTGGGFSAALLINTMWSYSWTLSCLTPAGSEETRSPDSRDSRWCFRQFLMEPKTIKVWPRYCLVCPYVCSSVDVEKSAPLKE